MTSSELESAHMFGGRYQTKEGSWDVVLKPCGETLEVVGLRANGAGSVAIAADHNNFAALFTAPRAGADVYKDWAEYEWTSRLGTLEASRTRVWRIAETLNWATFLGQAVQTGDDEFVLPLAAALWRQWSRRHPGVPGALFWPSETIGHLWLTDPHRLPRYIRLGSDTSADALVFALSRFADPREVSLDVGATTADFYDNLARIFPGRLRRAEPFADLIIAPSVREEIQELENPSMLMPALGAARVRAEGAPAVLNICESSQAFTADGV